MATTVMLVSKYSNACKDVISRYKLPDSLHIVCVDNSCLRKSVLINKEISINTVPCILTIHDNGTIIKYSKEQVYEWLDANTVKQPPEVRQKPPTQLPPSRKPMVHHTPPQPQISSQPPLQPPSRQPLATVQPPAERSTMDLSGMLDSGGITAPVSKKPPMTKPYSGNLVEMSSTENLSGMGRTTSSKGSVNIKDSAAAMAAERESFD